MAFDYEGAKKAGYSDTEIADHLAKQNGFDAAGARKSGYSDADIVQHLTKAQASAPAKSEPSFTDKLGRQLGLTGRYLMEGAESAVTYPVRAVAEAASGVANLAGKKDVADYIHRTLGMGGNAGRVVADAASLPTPQGKLENAVAGGSRMLAGLGAGGAVNQAVGALAPGAPQMAKDAVQGLMPGASSTGEAVLASGIGAGLEAAPEATLGTLGTIAALKGGQAVLNKAGEIQTNRAATKFIEKAGDADKARVAAEVTKDFKTLASNPNLKNVDEETGVIGAALRNEKAKSYIGEVKSALQRVDPDLLAKYDVETILKSPNTVDPSVLSIIRTEKNGNILADAIEKAQIAKAMTAPTPASGSIPAIIARAGIASVPAAVGGAIGGIPGAALGGMLTPLAEKYGQRIMGKSTIPEVITKMASEKQQRVADEVLKRLGPSQAALGADELANAARQAEKAQATAAAQRAADAEKMSGILSGVSEKMGVVNRSGPLRTLEDGFGMKADEIDDVLKKLVTENPELQTVVDQLYKTGGRLDDNGLLRFSDIVAKATGKRFNVPNQGVLNQTGRGVLYNGTNVSVGTPDVSKMIYGMSDDQVSKLLGRETDTLGKGIDSAKAYLTTRASRALETFTNGGSLPEADKELLKQLGLI